MGGGGFNEISQHIIVLNFQGGNLRLAGIIGLHPSNHRPRFVAQGRHLIQLYRIASGDKPTISRQKGRLGDQGAIQFIGQGLKTLQIICCILQEWR